MKTPHKAIFILLTLLSYGCYKKSTDVCPTSEVPRSLNAVYQAHWPAAVSVTSNYTDTVFVYRYIDDFELISTLDSTENGIFSFVPYERYVVYIDQPDSLLPSLEDFVSISAVYTCPDPE